MKEETSGISSIKPAHFQAAPGKKTETRILVKHQTQPNSDKSAHICHSCHKPHWKVKFYKDIWKTLAVQPVSVQSQAKKSLSERFQRKPFKVKFLWDETTEIKHETDCVFFCPAVKGLQKKENIIKYLCRECKVQR